MTNSDNSPLVSIGMPLYNEERHLDEAISSLLNQTYNNIIINIVDNNSQDNTKSICEKYASLDSRINYIENDKNIGGGLNFRKVVNISLTDKSKYFFFCQRRCFLF